jgi:hypothetical protein
MMIHIPVQDLHEPAATTNTSVSILYTDDNPNDQFMVADQRACALRSGAAGCINAIRLGRYSGAGHWTEGKPNTYL